MNEETLFHRALQMPAAERAAFLARACGGDLDMRRRVEILLEAHDNPDSRLEPNSPAFAPTIAQPTIAEAPGSVIGPYKLLEQIGEGGFGIVFMAEQLRPVRRKVAFKILKPGMDTRQVIARFEAERQALALMEHANIARVFDAGATESGRPYFVMELVKGVPITEYCDANQLTPRERLELFVSVCQAVQHAHQKGIIHRDIKPSNVMVSSHDGQPVVKVIDFGVAKALGQQLTDKTVFTGFAQMIGTPLYMSPEQAEFSGLDVDTRTDIYSLGVLLYELLTGTTPFDKERLKSAAFDEIRRIIREDEPPKPSTRLSDLSRSGLPSRTSGKEGAASPTGPAGTAARSGGRAGPTSLASIAALRKMEPRKLSQLVRGELDWIVMKALEKDRTRRYETANAFAADVLHYLSDEPVSACPPSATYRLGKFARRNKSAFAFGATVALALVVAIVALSVSNVLVRSESHQKELALEEKGRALHDKDEALQQKGQALIEKGKALEAAETARQKAAENEKLARRRFYAAQMNLAMQAWEAGHPARMLQLLESQRPRFDEDDLRGFDWYYLWRLCQGAYRFSLPKANFDNASPIAISPDGKLLASGYGRTVRLWDVATGRPSGELPGHDNFVEWLAIAPDGKTLASSDRSVYVKLWDLATGKERVALYTGQVVTGVQFTGDSRTLVLGGKRIKLWDVVANKELVTLGESRGEYGHVAVAPDGDAVAASNEGGVSVWVRDGSGWREAPRLTDAGYHAPVAISPDGKLLAIGEDRLRLFDLPRLQERTGLLGHTGNVYAVAFAGEGKRLVSAGHDRTVRMWDVATGEQKACIANSGPVYGLALPPDAGVLAAMGTDVITVFETAPPIPATVLRHAAPVLESAFSPDGRTLASCGFDGTKLWDLVEGRHIMMLPAPSNSPSCGLAFSPDGRSLATTGAAEGTIDLWDMTGRRLAVLKGTGYRLAFAPDGKSLAAAGDGVSAALWDVASQQRRHTLPVTTTASCVAFSPDGKTIAAGGKYGVVKLFDAQSGRELTTLQRFELAVDNVFALAFSPDGRKLAAGNQQGVVHLWDVASNRLDGSLIGHTSAVQSLVFADDGRTLATAGEDRTIRLWDVATGQERIALKGHLEGVRGAAFAPDGNLLATSSIDGTVRLWRAAADANARARKREVDPDDAQSPVAQNERGDRLWQYDRTGEAESAYRQALERLENLRSAFPDDPAYQQELVRSLLSISLLLRVERDDHPQAESARLRAREAYRKLSPQQQEAVFVAFQERCRKLSEIGNAQQASRIYSQMIELMPEDDAVWLARAAYHLANCPDARLRNPPRSIALARQAVAVCEKRVNDFPANPYYRLQLARSLRDTGDLDGALTNLSAAVEVATAATPDLKYRLAEGSSQLARFLRDKQRLGEAERLYRQAIAFREPLRDAPPDIRLAQANDYNDLAFTLEPAKRLPEAEQAVRAALALKQRLVTESPGDDAYQMHLGHTLWGVADLSAPAGRHDEAEKTLRRALDVWEKLAADFPGKPYFRVEQGFSHWKLGWLMNSLSRVQEAEEPFRHALAVYTQLAADYPQNLDYRIRLSQSHTILAETLVRQGKHADAAGEWDNAEAEWTKAIALKPDAGDGWNGRAYVHFNRQQWEAAIADFSKAIDLAPEVHTNWWHRGNCYFNLAQWNKAAADFGKVVDQWPERGDGWYFRAVALAQLNQPDKAVADLRLAITKGFSDLELMKNDSRLDPLRARDDFGELLREFERKEKSKVTQVLPQDPAARASQYDTLRSLGELHRGKQLYKEAEEAFRSALEISRKLLAESPLPPGAPWRLVRASCDLATILEKTDRSREAAELCREAAKECRSAVARESEMFDDRNLAGDRWNLGLSLEALGQLLNELGEPQEAENCLHDAQAIWLKLVADLNLEDHRFHLGVNYELLGRFLRRRARAEEAVECYRAARDVWEKLVAEFNQEDRRTHLGFTNEVLGALMDTAGRLDDAARAYRDAADVRAKLAADFPGNATYYNNFAWLLATSPASALRDGSRAVELARRAIELAPGQPAFWNTLGAAQYRAGNWNAAIEALTKSQELGSPSPAHDWFFLAMAERKLGNQDAARGWYDKADKWINENQTALEGAPQNAEELKRFRTEASELLGVKEK